VNPATLQPVPTSNELHKPIVSTLTSQDLHLLWTDVMESWLGLATQYFSIKDEGGIDLPLERLIRFEDPIPGVLVVRSQKALERVLKEVVDRNKPQASQGRDLFTEAVVRFWQKMIYRVFGKDGRDLRPARFRVSTPLDWPHREADVSCLSFVGRCPLEILVWFGPE